MYLINIGFTLWTSDINLFRSMYLFCFFYDTQVLTTKDLPGNYRNINTELVCPHVSSETQILSPKLSFRTVPMVF